MRHLLSIADLTTDDLVDLLDLAEHFDDIQQREIKKVPALRGKTVVNVFFEDSTRTRTSFDLAARRLSADVVTFSAGSSSVKKGESLRDTVETISAMGVDALVVRHRSSGVPQRMTAWTDASVVNAGDGWHQHPTQALLDAFTIRRRLGSLVGLRIALCGDVNHSRVARSNVDAFTKLGADVVLVGPRTLLPPEVDSWPVTVATDIDEVLGEIDVAYLLRIQTERIDAALLPSLREYRALYGFTRDRLEAFRADGVIMHPGPMNRGVEIDPEVADDDRAVVLDQVASGVGVRMAVLYRVIGPGRFDDAEPESPLEEAAGAPAEREGELSGVVR